MRGKLASVATRHGLAAVVVTAAVSVGLRLWIAASTTGTDDVRYWSQFAEGVRRFGPIGIYGHSFEAQYNHPPLAGWLLLAANHLQQLGLPFPFLIRAPACLADGATGLLLFLLLSREGNRSHALAASVLFLLSPLGIIVSGFHGNTDPMFVMLAVSALYQSQVRHRHLSAGVLLALSISVKLVPIVLVPLFLIRLAGGCRRDLVRFAAGGALVGAVLWVPVLVLRPAPFMADVVGYVGNGLVQWGVLVIAVMLGASPAGHELTLHVIGYVAICLSAALPMVLARHRPDLDLMRFGLVLALFLLLSPAFGMQYLVWPLAASYLVTFRYATLYNVAASAFALAVYSRWNHALPWNWSEARSTLLPAYVAPLMFASWLALLGVVLFALERLLVSNEARAGQRWPDRRGSSTVRPVA